MELPYEDILILIIYVGNGRGVELISMLNTELRDLAVQGAI